MFATTLRRASFTLYRGRTNQLFVPVTNKFFASNIRDDRQHLKTPIFETPNQTASKDAGIGSTQGQNWKNTANDAVGGVKNPAKEWASEIKDKIREPAGNTAPAPEGQSNEWSAPGSAKDTLKNPQGSGKKGDLDAEERHYTGTAASQPKKGGSANVAGGKQTAEDTHGSVHDTDQTGRGTTYVGIKGGKPDYSGDPAKTRDGTADISGGTASQYPGDTSRKTAKQAAGTSKSTVTADDMPTSTTGQAQDRNVNNLGKGNRH